MFKHKAWTNPEFQRFWQQYRNTSNKYKTIRRGERHLSHTLYDAGLTSTAMLSRDMLDKYVDELKGEALHRALAGMCTLDQGLESEMQRTLLAFSLDQTWDQIARSLIRRATEKQNTMATAPIFMFEAFGVPYIKKSLDPGNRKALIAISKWIESGQLPNINPCVAREIKERL